MNTVTSLFLAGFFFLLATSSFADPRIETKEKQIESLVFTCYTCHGTDGESPGDIPSLKGRSAEKNKAKLLAFRQDKNDPTIMNRIARGYSEDEISRIADYLAAIK